MLIWLARLLWSWIEPVYVDDSHSSRNRSAALCRFRNWEILVECFEERATPVHPRQIEWWSHRTPQRRSLLLRCGTWRWAVRYLATVLSGRYSWPNDEPLGGASVRVPAGPRGPARLPPAMERYQE